MDDCIFCKIVRGEAPCAKVYEDSDVIAFLSIPPNNKGHTLVIPKEHYETILDVPEEILCRVVLGVQKVAGAVKQGTGCGGFNIVQNNFRTAGQIVSHLHFHIIPRVEDDGFRFWPSTKYDEGEIEEWRLKITEALEQRKL
ncbi:HIT family protein [Candidatus Woesearchaeota archaeon]|nr:HIT family protein [Candidatus Woesearchaeota archaeon]